MLSLRVSFHINSTTLKSMMFFSQFYCYTVIYQEDNGTLLDVILNWFTNDKFKLNHIDAEEPDIAEYAPLPFTERLAGDLPTYLEWMTEAVIIFEHSVYIVEWFFFPNEGHLKASFYRSTSTYTNNGQEKKIQWQSTNLLSLFRWHVSYQLLFYIEDAANSSPLFNGPFLPPLFVSQFVNRYYILVISVLSIDFPEGTFIPDKVVFSSATQKLFYLHVLFPVVRPRVCLQEGDPVPRDFTKLFTGSLFSINTKHVPAAVMAYDDLEVFI